METSNKMEKTMDNYIYLEVLHKAAGDSKRTKEVAEEALQYATESENTQLITQARLLMRQAN